MPNIATKLIFNAATQPCRTYVAGPSRIFWIQNLCLQTVWSYDTTVTKSAKLKCFHRYDTTATTTRHQPMKPGNENGPIRSSQTQTNPDIYTMTHLYPYHTSHSICTHAELHPSLKPANITRRGVAWRETNSGGLWGTLVSEGYIYCLCAVCFSRSSKTEKKHTSSTTTLTHNGPVHVPLLQGTNASGRVSKTHLGLHDWAGGEEEAAVSWSCVCLIAPRYLVETWSRLKHKRRPCFASDSWPFFYVISWKFIYLLFFIRIGQEV